MLQSRKAKRPTGLPVRTNPVGTSVMATRLTPEAETPSQPVPGSRRSSVSYLPKSVSLLKIGASAYDAKSVQNLTGLQEPSIAIRKTSSFHCLKLPSAGENKRKLELIDPIAGPQPKVHALDVRADCEKALKRISSLKLPSSSENKRKLEVLEASGGPSQPKILHASGLIAGSDEGLNLHCKVTARYSSELDDSVISLLSEQMDLLGAKLDISVASGISEAADRTPSVEDLPIECEAVTPGQVTSVMSLDTGYQGDGELSRPESRNAESEIRILKTQDDMKAMTDSDFFTESDADGHDEAGLGRRGDRKAQVIDGTLYGGPNERSQAEDMESSGIYSDLERKPEPPTYHDIISQQFQTIQNLVSSHVMSSEQPTPGESMVKSSSGDSSITIQEIPTIMTSPADSLKKEPVRKNKMPNRNVSSKVKTMITKEVKTEAKARTPKRGRWDAVMDKIAANREKAPATPRLQEVKSKVYQAVQSPRVGSSPASSESSKSRSRRSTRVRCSESSLVSPKSKQSRTSANSSPHSSISDLSIGSSPSAPASRGGKKRDGTGAVPSRDHGTGTITSSTPPRSRETNVGVTKGPVLNNNQMKAPLIRRPATPRTTNQPLKDVNQNGVVTKSTSATSIHSTTPNNNNINNIKAKTVVRSGGNKSGVSPRPGVPRVSRDVVPIAKRQLRDSNRAVDALAALLNYCTQDLDAFRMPYLKKQLELKSCRVQELDRQLTDIRETCRKLETDLTDSEAQADQLRTEECNLRIQLEGEQRRATVLQRELDTAVTECQRLEAELATSRDQHKSDHVEFLTQRQMFGDLSARFDQVLNLKRESDDSLRECRERNAALDERLRGKESEVNVLQVENVKLGETVSLLKSENEELRGVHDELERLRVSCVSERGKETAAKKVGLCVDQRLSKDVAAANCVLNGASDATLLSEVESLRQVLALKTEEVIELRRQQLHHRVEAERVPKLLSLITSLEAKVEDIQSQLSSQQDAVRNLKKEKEQLQDELKSESAQRIRLSHKNEELVYKLRVNTDAMWQLASRNERTVESSTPLCTSPRKSEPEQNNRPQMVGVVQKSDSVSYILDMGENTEELVSSIVRRAECARSQTLPKKKRARTLGSIDTPGSEYYSCMESPLDSPLMTPRRPARMRGCIRLSQEDFATDSIEVPRGADCDVIEISGSFDRPEPDMSCSTSSNSSSNFDIESEGFTWNSSSPDSTKHGLPNGNTEVSDEVFIPAAVH